MQSFYWHDYETWGSDPMQDRPAQFAGLRTDMDLNVIGKPQILYCQPPVDLLPEPEACLITGITPQLAQQKGVLEYEFAAHIHREFATPGTCGVGYNSIRFDDEVTRHLLYRNFYDPYRREWDNNNSRWDIIDMVRACYALRPDGINWPQHDDGKPSFKLEDLTSANNIIHEASHDALSDVYATISLAKLIKEKKPKLFDYLFSLRKKQAVIDFLRRNDGKPFLHISRMYAAERGCAAFVLPITPSKSNQNEIICYDLSVDPAPLIEHNIDEIRRRVFSAKDELEVERIPLKSIKINHCPVVCSANILTDVIAARLHIDRKACEEHYLRLAKVDSLAQKLQDIFTITEKKDALDPEIALYAGGFIGDVDREKMHKIHAMNGRELAAHQFAFRDTRLPTLLFRYRARNFPDTLTMHEKNEWMQFCRTRLMKAADEFNEKMTMLKIASFGDAKRLHLLEQLEAHLNTLLQMSEGVT
ncbi:MAG: exodeoxyribonuclease I [Gammaproteobacteria bacterium RIFCSPHIGHO2_12_FULL_43_28]|nr:MAG: exodeoxyribonuclease I [Gammaproteobacteria bacterium RIFCSPHIGHO2_12_FULL_43_28]